MNQDWRDERIRELFHELSEQDERSTRSFRSVLEASRRRRRLSRPLLVWRVAAAVAVPVIGLVLLRAVLWDDPIESLPPVDASALMRLPHPQPNLDVAVELEKERRELTQEARRLTPGGRGAQLRNRRAPSRTYTQAVQISHWQAPTDFLLKIPGSEFLRKLPQMPHSPPGITRGLPDSHN